jgi:5'-nucleotidase/UDP-sugar diphosphatase
MGEMNELDSELAAASYGTKTGTVTSGEIPTRRVVLASAAAVGATIVTGTLSAAAEENAMKKTFTILHTNDMHSAFIGMGPSSDYTPFTLNDDATRGGYARLASVIATRKAARAKQGPVLILDAGDYSMGTAFGAASRETGGELRIMSLMGYDATTFGNHDFDLGPEGLAE